MYIAVDIGGTKTLVVGFDDSGNELGRNKFETKKSDDFIEDLTSVIREVAGDQEVDAIGMAAPGLIDYEKAEVVHAGNLDWNHFQLGKDLEQHFNSPVIVDNDANLGAIGEANLGAGRDYEVVLYVTVSTGIGTGITVNGKVPVHLRKSEGGQMYFVRDGQPIRWEKIASGKAFYEKYGRMGRDIGTESEEDKSIWSEYSSELSLGFKNLITVIQPDVIVVGGSMGVHFPKYSNDLVSRLDDLKSPTTEHPPIIQANDPENAVINGCYWAARHHVDAS